ncbi:MAG: bicyclomycin resistance protein [Rubrivivax sp.]|nr:bicyclomycin resistance protein [Rubrivivax sp.]
MKRRDLLTRAAAAWPMTDALARAAEPASGHTGEKVFRYALNTAETGFDPPRVSDQSSIRVLAHIFEPPLAWDRLARPAKLVPLVAAALPEVSDEHCRFVFTIRPGIFFADDPAFEGRPRELVASDFVYTIKRFYDPALRSEWLYQWENAKILGLSELRKRVLEQRKPFPYDEEVAGLRALDRYRFEVRLADPAPRFAANFTSFTLAGAVAREVIERYQADPQAHPVGTGPFRLHQWRRASHIVLTKNPRFREQRFAADPPDDDPVAQAHARRLAGARAPLVDRLEFSVIEESQPRWLAFLNGEHDAIAMPVDLAGLAVPGGQLAPYLVRRGIQLERQMAPSITHTFFNFDDPLVGGYTPDKVALRRAVMLAFDSALEARLVFSGQALPAQSMVPPGCYGAVEPGEITEMSRSNPARAAALLDMYGYVDRNGDGFREQPDGKPLVLRIGFLPDQRSRRSSDLWFKRMKAVGLRTQFEVAPFAEQIRRALAGTLMMWGYTWSASSPDGDFFLGLAYGPNAEQSNDARFKLAAFDRLYERQRVLPDGPERLALMREANKIMLAYTPYIAHLHQVNNDLLHAHVRGPMRQPFSADWFRWIDVGATSPV